jgi:bifunctional DNase/RNase
MARCSFLILIGTALAAVLSPLPGTAAEGGSAGAPQVRVEQVDVRASPVGPVVLLKVGSKAIPIFVDAIVAESIRSALTGQKTRRPLTHELMRAILAGYEGKVTQVIVTLKGGTFYAALSVLVRDTPRVFDSRSSDAIALALHFKAPILVPRELVDSAGVDLDDPAPRPRGSET